MIFFSLDGIFDTIELTLINVRSCGFGSSIYEDRGVTIR